MTPAQLAALTPEEREMWALCEAATPTRWAYEEQAEAIRTALPAALETIANLRADLAAANRQIAELRTQLLDIGRGDPPPGWSASEDALFERALNADGSAMLYVYLPEDGRCAWEYSLEQPRTSVIEHVPGGVFDAIAAAERYAKESL